MMKYSVVVVVLSGLVLAVSIILNSYKTFLYHDVDVKKSDLSKISKDCDCDNIFSLLNYFDSTNIFYFNDTHYNNHAQLHHWGSHYIDNNYNINNSISPSIIIYIFEINEIINIVKYANKCNFILSIRSSGHQYNGFSSCHSKLSKNGTINELCILLDLSNFKYFDYNDNDDELTVGVGIKLIELYEYLLNYDIFIPSGFCNDVAVGGHFQSSSYGLFSSSFGLGFEYIKSFDIILSNGTYLQNITYYNSDLFYGVFSGFPGSFGIITQYTFDTKLLHTINYQNSSYILLAWIYDIEDNNISLQITSTLSKIINLLIINDYKFNYIRNNNKSSDVWILNSEDTIGVAITSKSNLYLNSNLMYLINELNKIDINHRINKKYYGIGYWLFKYFHKSPKFFKILIKKIFTKYTNFATSYPTNNIINNIKINEMYYILSLPYSYSIPYKFIHYNNWGDGINYNSNVDNEKNIDQIMNLFLKLQYDCLNNTNKIGLACQMHFAIYSSKSNNICLISKNKRNINYSICDFNHVFSKNLYLALEIVIKIRSEFKNDNKYIEMSKYLLNQFTKQFYKIKKDMRKKLSFIPYNDYWVISNNTYNNSTTSSSSSSSSSQFVTTSLNKEWKYYIGNNNLKYFNKLISIKNKYDPINMFANQLTIPINNKSLINKS